MNWADPAEYIGALSTKTGLFAGFWAVLGGICIQILNNRHTISEKKLTSEDKRLDLTLAESTQLRSELRATVIRLENEINCWKQKYFDDIEKIRKQYFDDIEKIRKQNFEEMEKLRKQNYSLILSMSAMQIQINDLRARNEI